jgi:hypothetical protein
MLKLICINSQPVMHQSGIVSYGSGLIEGRTYSAEDVVFVHPNNKKLCYFIEELDDLKLLCRFIPISDVDETALIKVLAVTIP